MTGTFFGLDLALRALQTQRMGLDVANHNVANANTPGFSRQNVAFETTAPFTVPAMHGGLNVGQLGTGVQAAAIQRARDIFLDLQYRVERGGGGQVDVAQQALEQIEVVLNEPSATGLSGLFAQFFGAWQELADDPSNGAVRATLAQRAAALAGAFNRSAQQLARLGQQLSDRLRQAAVRVNDLGAKVAELNREVARAEAFGQRANDLRDRRDLLLDELAQLAPIAAVEQSDGTVDVSLGGHAFVAGFSLDPLTTLVGPGGAWQVRFSSDNAAATLSSGELGGLVEARDVTIPKYVAGLDAIAADLAGAVNTLHSGGYGQDGLSGRSFFAGTTAATLAVDPAIAADPTTIAAADAPGQAGNSAVALAIARLRDSLSPTTEGAYATLVAALGAESESVRGSAANQATLLALLERRRQSQSGVSLDEEAVNVLRYQRAYEAAARLITANDQLLDKLINETGIVGR